MQISRAALLVIAKKWKQSKCVSTGVWISKIQYIHTMDYYSAVISNEVLILSLHTDEP